MSDSNWGGAREGAGKKPGWKTGPTKPIRLPVTLHDAVYRYAKRLDEVMDPSNLESVTDSKMNYLLTDEMGAIHVQKVIEILNEALQLKANAGGAIKTEIRKALEILESFTSLLEIL